MKTSDQVTVHKPSAQIKMDGDDKIFFSRRLEISREVDEWFKQHPNISTKTNGVVTVLQILGYLRDKKAEPEQGQGERSCENCGRDCSGHIATKDGDVCGNWQPIPGEVDDKNLCDCCQKGITDICNHFESITDMNFEYREFCQHCGHHKDCHE